MTADLEALANWIEDRLSEELASRQHIAEAALAGIRDALAGGGLPLGLGDALTVLSALADAIAFRGAAIGRCPDCGPGRPCAEHEGDAGDQAAYRALSARLGDADASGPDDAGLAGLRAEVVDAIDVAIASSGAVRQLGEIRAVLAGFDWEFDDRQLALEQIGRIVSPGGAS